MPHFKNFIDSFRLKPKLDCLNHKPPFVSERDIWWCHFGENIGTEISGKGDKYNRPAIIYRKLSKYTFLVIPASTQIKEGSWFVFFNHNNIDMVACLHQIRVIDYRRIEKPIGKLNSPDFKDVQQGFKNLYE